MHECANFFKILKDPTCAIFFKCMGFKDIKYDIPLCHEGHKGHEDICISLHFFTFLFISVHLSAFLMQFSAFPWISHTFLCISQHLNLHFSLLSLLFNIIHHCLQLLSIINFIHYYSHFYLRQKQGPAGRYFQLWDGSGSGKNFGFGLGIGYICKKMIKRVFLGIENLDRVFLGI